MATGNIRTAVITGQHEYDVIGFQSLFRSIPEIDAYHLEGPGVGPPQQ